MPRQPNMAYRRVDPFEEHDNEAIFYSKYRFRKRDVDVLERMLAPLLSEVGFEPWCIPKRTQILMTLRYLATNSHQLVVADIFGVSQKTICNVVRRVIQALNHEDVVARFLKFRPDSEEWCREKAAEFAQQCKFSNIVGAIDGTLVKVQQPSQFGWQYFCRKACFSVNMVAIVDARARFLYVDCRYPGRCHDSAIWTRSEASEMFESGRAASGYRLLGDSGFRNSLSVLTPYRDSAAHSDRKKAGFNDAHSHGRMVVEQAFGALKRRFPFLESTARLEPPHLQQAIMACVVLYNFGIAVGAQRGQSLSGEVRAVHPHPPPGRNVREFMTQFF